MDVESSRPGDPSFEELLARLKEVVERLEKGDLPLEESLAVFEEGIRLSRLGERKLDEAERRVELLLSRDGTAETTPFEESNNEL